MLHQVLTYLKWLPKTFHLHGVHSPFVYTLYKECLQNKKKNKNSRELAQYKKRLRSIHKTIEVTDFGAGSRVFKSNTRKISKIAKYAGATTKRMELLERLVTYLKPEQILEIGTSLGMATYAMALADKKTTITSLEGCPNTLQVARKSLDYFNIPNVKLIEGSFRESIKDLNSHKIDMIYFDGNHSKDATMEYVHSLLPTAVNGTVWIFDDIHWSPEMTQAWDKIKTLPEISVTIDCYYLGFAFFRNEQVKEDFYLRAQ